MLLLPANYAHSETSGELIFPNENFNRLFTKAETRRMLDQNKTNTGTAMAASHQAAEKSQTTIPQRRTMIKIKGYILSEDGKQKVWLSDNKGLSENSLAKARASFELSRANKVAVQAQGQARLLKPGQTWFVDDRKVEENYLLIAEDTANAQTANNPAKEDTPSHRQALHKIRNAQGALEKSTQPLQNFP